MPWYTVADLDSIPSPALLVYPERVAENLDRMIAYAGGVERLRPHVKTHKTVELTRLQLDRGISKFKCSTIAEAEMVAMCGANDVLLAIAAVGPNLARFVALAAKYARTRFSTLADDPAHAQATAEAAQRAGIEIELLVDLDVGMHRSGIEPSERALALYRQLCSSPGIRAGGLHIYDGHLRAAELAARTAEVSTAFAPVDRLAEQIRASGLPLPRIVAGGTFSFPIHARRSDIECSPGTPVLWDQAYATKVPDLDFLHALVVLGRVVSRPAQGRLTLDLGYKAISADNADPRVVFPEIPDARMVNHSEEHLVIETTTATRYAVGDAIYGIPWHVCPTVALHDEMRVIESGRSTGAWQIVARKRRMTI
ncbi:MAG TPA: D-TA family PLP-dependent enzyme [Pirellulales bacterium]|nr:D-TA family PLP-dependent enzyme [Pirellulales bacterium]